RERDKPHRLSTAGQNKLAIDHQRRVCAGSGFSKSPADCIGTHDAVRWNRANPNPDRPVRRRIRLHTNAGQHLRPLRNRTMSLNVPAPTLTQESVMGNRFFGEKPIQILCGPVTFPDGSTLRLEQATLFNYAFYRELSGGIAEVWNEPAGSWQPSTTVI